MDYYINESARAERKDPRQELEKFVFGNFGHITPDRKKEIADTYRLRAEDERAQLKEFVLTNNPYDVLKQCFAPGRLHILAENSYSISPDSGLNDHELRGVILDRLGYKREVKPIGLSQIRNDLKPLLDEAKSNTVLEPTHIDGLLAEMARKMEGLLIGLFLFHSGVLRSKLAISEDIEKYDQLCKLCEKYQTQKKQMGHYVRFLNDLMKMFEDDAAPLKTCQISEVGLFTVYRNLTMKNPDEGFWKQNKSHAETCIKSINDAYNKWKEGWNAVVNAWNQKLLFPKRDMLQRMADFFQDFLDLLFENQIYPRVIVMQRYTIDHYGIRKIYAIDDDNKEVEFIDDKFVPFTEYYYHSRTNSVGIDPILVPKEELEVWAIPPDDM